MFHQGIDFCEFLFLLKVEPLRFRPNGIIGQIVQNHQEQYHTVYDPGFELKFIYPVQGETDYPDHKQVKAVAKGFQSGALVLF